MGENPIVTLWNRTWKVLFVLQLQLLVGTSIYFGNETVASLDVTLRGYGQSALRRIAVTSFGCSAVTSASFVIFATVSPRRLVRFAFFATPLTICITCFLLLLQGRRGSWERTSAYFKSGLWGLVIMSVSYLIYIRHVHFASTTLRAALKAARTQSRLFYQSIVLVAVDTLMVLLWMIAFYGVIVWSSQRFDLVPCSSGSIFSSRDIQKSQYGTGLCEQPRGIHLSVWIFFLVSVFWTHHTFRCLCHVTAANSIRRWWKEGNSDKLSLVTALPFDFGSLCFDSFVIPLLQFVWRLFADHLQENEEDEEEETSKDQLATKNVETDRLNMTKSEDQVPTKSVPAKQAVEEKEVANHASPGLLQSIVRSIKNEIRQVAESACDWSFVLLGLYGSNFVSAYQMVTQELRSKKMEHTLRDPFMFRIMLLCNIAIATISGCMAWLYDTLLEPYDEEFSFATVNFRIAFLLGLLMGNSILTYFGGAVRTMTLCFIETLPADDLLRTRLAFEMKRGWQSLYPELHK